MAYLTREQIERRTRLEQLVSIRTDEYLEKLEGEERPEAPAGDIAHELKEAAKDVLMRLDRVAVLSAAENVTNADVINTDISTIVPLPDDYLRFLRIKLDSWKRNVTFFYDDDSPKYAQQTYAMRRGTKSKPMAFMVPQIDTYTATYKETKVSLIEISVSANVNPELKIDPSGWQGGTNLSTLTIDGVPYQIGGFQGSVSLSAADAATTIKEQLNDENLSLVSASGYDSLPSTLSASVSSGTVTVTRTNSTDFRDFTYELDQRYDSEIGGTVSRIDGFAGVPKPGDILQSEGVNVAEVNSATEVFDEDDDSISKIVIDITVTDPSAVNTGSIITEENDKYDLTIDQLKGDTFTKKPLSKRSIECYPQSTAVDNLVYVPTMRSYELPTEFEDALVWNATGRVLIILRQTNLASLAFQQFSTAIAILNQGNDGERNTEQRRVPEQ